MNERKYTFAPPYKKPEPRKPRDFSRLQRPVWFGVFIFWVGIIPLSLWSMLFGTPGDRFLMFYFGLMFVVYLGWYRLAVILVTAACFIWLYF